jgi:uncharacterized protein YegJ (DUF2314 family)
MKLLTIGLISLCAAGSLWAAEQEKQDAARQETKESGHPAYTQVGDNDGQMDRAVEKAQRSLGFFMAALHAKKDGDAVFEIKKAFVDGDKVEHIWLRGVSYDGKNFHGSVDNRALDVKNAHMGQHVTVAPGDVVDWMFVKDGKLMGGFTTRVLYARLSPEEKAAFDNQADFKIE